MMLIHKLCNSPTHETEAYRFFVGNGINKLFERALPEGERTEENVLKIRSQFIPYYDEVNQPTLMIYLYQRVLYKRWLFLLEGGFLTVKQPYNTTIYNTALYLRLSRDDELQLSLIHSFLPKV